MAAAACDTTLVCDNNSILFENFNSTHVNADIDLLYSNQYLTAQPLYPYLTNENINAYLATLDLDLGENEFHKNWRDFELLFNYFHGGDSTSYYGTFGTGNPSMRFFDGSCVPLSDRNHIDIYFNHLNAGYDFYPAHTGSFGQPYPDIKEDGGLSTCDEISRNAVQVTPGWTGARNPSNPWEIVTTPDSIWYHASRHANVRIDHEVQHLTYFSRPGLGGSFSDETFAMAAEYLGGAQERDAIRPIWNNVYDVSLLSSVPVGYSHWYLWSIYLFQQFVGDTTDVTDDLYYKWVRALDTSVTPSRPDNSLQGLAKVLDDTYNAFGSTGRERLRNIYHNYALAKWIDNPSSSFYAGNYGFARGIDPYSVPGFFDNSFNPRDRRSANEVPPKYVVGQAQAGTPAGPQNHQWCYIDKGQGGTGTGTRMTCDNVGVSLWGTDYIQFESSPYFESAQSDTLHFSMTWDTAKYPVYPNLFSPGTNTRTNLRVSAVTYSVRSDSLYRMGTSAIAVTDGVIDTVAGRCDIRIPDFGGSAKSVLVTIDWGEEDPAFKFLTSAKLNYDYQFEVTPTSASPAPPPTLEAFRPSGASTDSLQITDASSYGVLGYYLQRSTGNLDNFATVDSLNSGELRIVSSPPSGSTIKYYRLVPRWAPLTLSNVATPGGLVDQTHTLVGSLAVSGDVTISTGDTLNISPGARIRMRPSYDSQHQGYDNARVEFLANGALRSLGVAGDSVVFESGATVPAPGDWKGLRVENPNGATASSRLEYTVVRHAYHGLQTGCSPSVNHSRIEHSQFYGIYMVGGTSVINYSVLQQNHGAEFASTYYAVPILRHNVLRYSSALSGGAIDDGAVFTTNGGGYIQYNTISGSGMGVYCVGAGTSPLFMGTGTIDSLKFGRNNILDFSAYGVRTYDDALPWLGTGSNANHYQAGHNNIYTTVNSTAPFVSHSGSSEMGARYNFWGASPPPSARFSGNIDGPQSNRYLSEYDSLSGSGFNPAPTLDPTPDPFEIALDRELAGDLDSAIEAYRTIVADNPDAQSSLRALPRIVTLGVLKGRGAAMLAYLDSLSSSSSTALTSLADRLRPMLLVRLGDKEAAYSAYERLLSSSGVNRSGVLFEQAVACGLLRDKAKAIGALSQLADCGDPALLKHARAMLEDFVGADAYSSSAADSSAGAPGSPELTLGQSWPNPMNPSTRIAFAIPRAGRTGLRIFDVRGRLVQSLVDEYLEAGVHARIWDGKSVTGHSVASGVYYYRLEYGTKRLTKKLLVLK